MIERVIDTIFNFAYVGLGFWLARRFSAIDSAAAETARKR